VRSFAPLRMTTATLSPINSSARAGNATYSPRELINLCRVCGGPLLARYDLSPARALRDEIPRAAGDHVALTLRFCRHARKTSSHSARASRRLLRPPSCRTSGSRTSREPHALVQVARDGPPRSAWRRPRGHARSPRRLRGMPARRSPRTARARDCRSSCHAPPTRPQSIVDECRGYGAEVELVAGVITDAAKARAAVHRRERRVRSLHAQGAVSRPRGKRSMG